MQPKSALFISTVLTTFVLAVLAGVVIKYQSAATVAEAQAPVATDVAVVEVLPTATATQLAPLTPEAAAALAAQFLNKTDLYSVELSSLNGVDAFLVTFSSGDLVYVGMDGQILSTIAPPPPVIAYVPALPVQNNQSGNTGGNNRPPRHRGGDDDGGGGGGDD
jgi:hypothetical protein